MNKYSTDNGNVKSKRMTEWKTVRLGDAYELQMGKTPDRKNLKYFSTTDNKWISIADISKADKYITETKEYISDEAVKKSGIKQIPANTVIMSFKLSIGKTAITTEQMYSNEAIMAFLPNGKYQIDNNYLYHLFSNKDWSEGSNKAVKGITLNKASLTEIKINLPPLEIQKKIAEILDKCNEIVAKNKKMLQSYDALIKSRFIEMFGDIQKYPKESFKECALFIDYRGHTPEVIENGTIRMINAKSVGKGFFKYINEFVTEEIYDSWMHRGFPKPNDVLFVTEGHTFGNTCQVPANLTKFALGQRVITIRGNENKLNNYYLNAYMQTDDFYKDINKYKTGGTAQGIRSKDLIKIEIPLPEYKLQNDFAAFVQQIDKSKFAVQKSLEKAETLYKSFMQEYFG